MAIPLTCPGCQAAFEVPDTLSGKTIRCTSCKTQLTVPAAGMADTKKPFGWASSPANPAVPKVALTRPAAKAAVAVAVVEDDEDDRKPVRTRPPRRRAPKSLVRPRAPRR